MVIIYTEIPVLGGEPKNVKIKFEKTTVIDKYKWYGKVKQITIVKCRKIKLY